MKIKPLLQYNGSDKFLSDYLVANGITENNVRNFVYPTRKLYQPPMLYKHMEEAIGRLNQAVENKEKIGIVVD